MDAEQIRFTFISGIIPGGEDSAKLFPLFVFIISSFIDSFRKIVSVYTKMTFQIEYIEKSYVCFYI